MRYASLLVCLALIGCSAGSPSTTAPKAATHADDPWPECKQIREYFAENLGEPQSFEVVKWERREPAEPSPRVAVYLKYRAKNKYGALEVRQADVHFRDGKMGAVNTAVTD